MSSQWHLPTDNFYKFCALAGVAISILSIYLPGTLGLKIDEQIFELKSEIAVTKIEAEHLAGMIDKNSKTLDNILLEKTDKEIRKKGKLPVPISIKEFLSQHEMTVRMSKDINIAKEKIKIKLERIERLLIYLIVVFIAGIVGLSIGFKLAWYGFTNWYTKIQLPLDQLNSIHESGVTSTPVAAGSRRRGRIPPELPQSRSR